MNSIADRAAEWGIEPSHVDAFGHRQEVSLDTMKRILEAVESGGISSTASPPSVGPAPSQSYQGDDPGSRLWVLAVQLYGVRSQRNWGHGDFTDLAALLDLAIDIGASGIGLNPLHALFEDQASPYSPNSRLFLNPLYIDIEAVPEFPGIEAIGGRAAIEPLRSGDMVDYAGVARTKMAALRLAYNLFRVAGRPERRQDFEAYRAEQGDVLARFASFETLRRRFAGPWWEWPERWRNPDDDAMASLREGDGVEVGFHEFVQWIADRQFAGCQARARARGMPIGLYVDIAVGVDPGGADAWSAQGAILHTLSAGAPPDFFNPGGQNWGIAAFNPRRLAAEGFITFRRVLAAAMRYAGAVRIDHVLGLNRLFLIPHGAPARDGAYFRFPLEAMFSVVAQESVAHRCVVIGEDLGTVPADFRDKLARSGVWSYRVLLFERARDGGFFAPQHYPGMALAIFSTHDLPTYVGWTSGYDIKVRQRAGVKSSETIEERQHTCARLADAIAYAGFNPVDGFAAVAGYLGATPCRLVAIAIEDVLGVRDQPNLPATIDEHPNWRQRLPVTLEDWRAQPMLQSVSQALEGAGRAWTGAEERLDKRDAAT